MNNKNDGIIWLRYDFRIIRNDALIYACKNHKKVCAIYIYKKKRLFKKIRTTLVAFSVNKKF